MVKEFNFPYVLFNTRDCFPNFNRPGQPATVPVDPPIDRTIPPVVEDAPRVPVGRGAAMQFLAQRYMSFVFGQHHSY